MYLRGIIVLVLVFTVRGQKKCKNDADCSEDSPCCSSAGYCGSGKGYCTDVAGVDAGVKRSGSGCTVDDVEYVGGDLSPLEGGGGIELKRDDAKACYNKCEDNFRCKWFTYDERTELCYLKGSRGYPRNRTDGFTSGSTERDGCDRDPVCEYPYSYYSYQCLYYCEEDYDLGISIADVRRNYNNSKEFCDKYGGFLPYQYLAHDGYRNADSWHWMAYPSEDGNCWACRPAYYQNEGVRQFPCETNLNFGCERRNRLYSYPVPPRPHVYTGPSRDALPHPGLLPSRWLTGVGSLPRRRNIGLLRRRQWLRRQLALERLDDFLL